MKTSTAAWQPTLALTLMLILNGLQPSPAWAGATALRDPTRPLASATAGSTASGSETTKPQALPALPRLQLVLIAGQRRYAVVDGELLSEGDSLKGLRILKIHSEAIVIATPNGPRTLRLPADNE